jgi:hypothetical protein
MEIVETTRQSIARMEREEQHLLTLRTSAHRSAADRAIASSLATTAVASGLLVASAALGRRLMPLAGATTPGLASTVRRLRPPGALRRRGRGESRCEANARVLDSDLGVLALIAVAVLGLCAVLLVVSRL